MKPQEEIVKVPGNVLQVSENGLCSDFWSYFVENYWEKKPCVIRGANITEPKAILSHCFSGIAQAHPAEGYHRPKFRFFIDGNRLDKTSKQWYLPNGDDTNLDAYLARLETLLKGKKFELVTNDTECTSFELFDMARRLISPLLGLVGIPQNGLTLTCFLRTFNGTSFGIHQDFGALFAMVLVGDKTILAWPSDYFPDQRTGYSAKVSDHIQNAQLLQAKPGDIIYWPSTDWHVGQNEADLSVSVHVCASYNRDVSVPFLEAALDEAKKNGRKKADFVNYPLSPNTQAGELPIEMQQSIQKAVEIMTSCRMMYEYKIRWLKIQSASGFSCPPLPREPKDVGPDTEFVGDPDFPILTMRGENMKLICASNGHLVHAIAHKSVFQLIECLNSGQTWSARRFSDRHPDSLPLHQTSILLKKFEAIRAIQRCNEKSVG